MKKRGRRKSGGKKKGRERVKEGIEKEEGREGRKKGNEKKRWERGREEKRT